MRHMCQTVSSFVITIFKRMSFNNLVPEAHRRSSLNARFMAYVRFFFLHVVGIESGTRISARLTLTYLLAPSIRSLLITISREIRSRGLPRPCPADWNAVPTPWVIMERAWRASLPRKLKLHYRRQACCGPPTLFSRVFEPTVKDKREKLRHLEQFKGKMGKRWKKITQTCLLTRLA